MIVFEARNSYELLVSLLLGKHMLVRDHDEATILAVNLDDSLNYSAIENCGIAIEFISAPRHQLGVQVPIALLRRHGLKCRNIERIFLFHEISPLSLGRLFGKEINMVEHGEINYRKVDEVYAKVAPRHPYALVKRVLGHSFVGEGRFFSHVYLKDPSASPAPLRRKTLPLELETYYDAMTPAERRSLSRLFSSSGGEISSTTATCTIITQPFSELGMMTEAGKIEMYRSIMSAASGEIYIKPHPKETTDYARAFPHVTILDQKSPFELLWLSGLRNSAIYTVNSSVGRMPGMNVVILGDSILDEFTH